MINVINLVGKKQNKLYIFLSYIFSIFFYNTYKIEEITLKNNEETISLLKYQLLSNKIIILNDGIDFYGLHIPYEYIIQFGYIENKIYLQLFANFIQKGNNQIKLNLGGSRISVSFKTNNAGILVKKMKNNMYWHLKWNNISPKELDYVV